MTTKRKTMEPGVTGPKATRKRKPPTKSATLTKPQDTVPPQEPFKVHCSVKYFRQETNEALKSRRVNVVTRGTIAVWIKRHIIKSPDPEKYFGCGYNTNTDEYEFWFTVERDREAFLAMVDEIKKNGFPVKKEY